MLREAKLAACGHEPAPAMGEPCGHCTIRHIGICHSLSDIDLDRVRRLVRIITVAPGRAIISEGDNAEYLFNVVSGALRVFRLLEDGRRQITGFLFPGDFLGLVFNDRYAYGADAITSTQLCRFSRRDLVALLPEIPTLEHRLLQDANNELTAAQDQILLLGRKTAKERVASFLLALAVRAGGSDHPAIAIDIPMTRADIADYLGLTTETISRTLTQLKKAKIIDLAEPARIEILRPNVIAGLGNAD
jgi:CRP/FNR family transcriptional regulator